jgi:hypothetical protein
MAPTTNGFIISISFYPVKRLEHRALIRFTRNGQFTTRASTAERLRPDGSEADSKELIRYLFDYQFLAMV